MKKNVNKETGLIEEGKLNEKLFIFKKRADGSLRIQEDYQYCPTMAEQHTAHLSDINYLVERYKPDELAAYMAARATRPEIIGHDFSREPDLQGAKNITYLLKKNFEALPEEIRQNFKNHVEFLKFIDNPANQEKMLKLGLMTKQEIKDNTPPATTPTTSEETKEHKA